MVKVEIQERIDIGMETALPQASAELPELLTVKQAAILWGVTKPAIRQRMSKLPEDAITRTVENGKEIIYLTTSQILSAWGAPPTTERESQPEEIQELTPLEIAAMKVENEALKRNLSELSEQFDSTRQELESVTRSRDKLQGQLSAAKDEIDEMLNAQQERERETSRTQTLLASVTADRDKLQIQLDGMSAAVDIQDRERDELKAHCEALQAQLAEKDKQIDQLHQLHMTALRTALPAPRQGLFARLFGRKTTEQ